MGCNWVSDDVYHVVQDSRPTKSLRKSPSESWKLPDFESTKNDLPLAYGKSIDIDLNSDPSYDISYGSCIEKFSTFRASAIMKSSCNSFEKIVIRTRRFCIFYKSWRDSETFWSYERMRSMHMCRTCSILFLTETSKKKVSSAALF